MSVVQAEGKETLEAEYLTPNAYLERERQAETKSEYYDGTMVAMAGASRSHIALTTTLSGLLFLALRGTNCHNYANEMKVRTHPTEHYFYPDIVVVCGEDVFRDDREELLTNPTLVVEILSPSTEAFDRGEKFRRYQQIPSLREYVLVAQDRASVERFVRQDDGNLWTYSLTEGMDANVTFESISATVSLGELYSNVLTPSPASASIDASPLAG